MSGEDKILGGKESIPAYLILFLIFAFLEYGIDGLLSVGDSFPGGPLYFFFCIGAITIIGLGWSFISKNYIPEYDMMHHSTKGELKGGSRCTSCGISVMNKNGMKKVGKAALYTPAGTYVFGTIGLALGGFPGMFLAGFFGGAAGYTTALSDKNLCEYCQKNK
jgi:hypothetical protein